MGIVHFPGVTYGPVATEAKMDVNCFYMKYENSPLLESLRETAKELLLGEHHTLAHASHARKKHAT
jgi:hypothetical protein